MRRVVEGSTEEMIAYIQVLYKINWYICPRARGIYDNVFSWKIN